MRRIDARPVEASSVEEWDIETDVLVVGFGIAGAAAALGAAERSDDVVVIERGGASEGTCGGIFYLGGGTPMQRAMGYDDTAEDMFNVLLCALGPGVDEAKLRRYCEESVAHFEWLRQCGVPLAVGPDPAAASLAVPADDGIATVVDLEYAGGGLVWTGGEQTDELTDVAPAVPRGHLPRDPDNGLADLFEGAVVQRMVDATVRAGVRVVCDAAAERLAVDGSGRVVGVVGRHEGKPFAVRARGGVVLATGGFVYNDEMLATHAPALLNGVSKLGHGGQDGLGIQMAQLVGANTIHMDARDAALPTTPFISFMSGLLVNGLGQRFANEDAYHGKLGIEAVFRQGSAVFLLLDEETYRDSARLRPTWASESAAELEREIGLPDGSLQETIEQYNVHAERGEDPLFRKAARWLKPLRAPYAVIDLREYAWGFTLGGLHTDVESRVLDVQGAPIDGLWAAGRATSGLAVHGYCSGISLGDGSFFGRVAGQNAASQGPHGT